jgi:hypothetical protein
MRFQFSGMGGEKIPKNRKTHAGGQESVGFYILLILFTSQFFTLVSVNVVNCKTLINTLQYKRHRDSAQEKIYE